MFGIVAPMIDPAINPGIVSSDLEYDVKSNTFAPSKSSLDRFAAGDDSDLSSGYSGIAVTDNVAEAMRQYGLSAAEEQEKNRRYNEEQAKIARDWYADMSGSAYQRAVNDMKAAGLNPALMFGSGQAAATAAGSAASYNVNPGDTASSMINSFASYGKYYAAMISAVSSAVNGLLSNIAGFMGKYTPPRNRIGF